MKTMPFSSVIILILMLASLHSVGANAERSAPGSLSSKLSIYYFYLSTCQYCARQEPVLESFSKRTGIQIHPVSLDGRAPFNPNAFGRYYVDQGEANMFGIQKTPTLFVRLHTGEMARLHEGFIGLNHLEQYLSSFVSQYRHLLKN